MQRIEIGRYRPLGMDVELPEGADDHCGGGWIRGERNDCTGWLIFIDSDGNPSTFWNAEGQDGPVVGEPIYLNVPRGEDATAG